jgi:hypothetical protein
MNRRGFNYRAVASTVRPGLLDQAGLAGRRRSRTTNQEQTMTAVIDPETSNGAIVRRGEHAPPASGLQLGSLQLATPGEVIETARGMAIELKRIVDERRLSVRIGKGDHIKIEGWCTLGSMCGLSPREVAVEERDGTYTATVEICRMSDGAVVSRASAECGDDEELWAGRARHARRSMALTRATGKAYRLLLAWVVVLAGYSGTPAEEMPETDAPPSPRRVKNRAAKPAGQVLGAKGAERLNARLSELDARWEDLLDEVQAINLDAWEKLTGIEIADVPAELINVLKAGIDALAAKHSQDLAGEAGYEPINEADLKF